MLVEVEMLLMLVKVMIVSLAEVMTISSLGDIIDVKGANGTEPNIEEDENGNYEIM
jgi:hypothetical protein